MSPFQPARRIVPGALALAVAACSADPATQPPPGPPQPVPVASVSLAAMPVVAVGGTAQLTATPRDAAGNALSGRVVTWSSSAPAVATVTSSGLVAGVSAGAATITAASEGRSATATLTVTAGSAPVASVPVAPAAATLPVGHDTVLVAIPRDSAGTALAGRAIAWTSSNPAVATVDSGGRVTGVDGGTAVIRATSDGVTGQATITVSRPVASVAVAPALDTLEAYETRPLIATLRDAEGRILTDRAVTWTSSDPAIAAVDQSRLELTGVDRGTVTVTATSEGVSATVVRVVVIRYRSLALGTMHACDLASGGIAWCWGLNGTQGRIGDDVLGPTAYRSRPFQVPGGHRFVQLASFAQHTCGLDVDGRIWCWGSNSWGSLGDGSGLSESPTPRPVAVGRLFDAVTVGIEHACGHERASDRIWCWGHNDWRQLGVNAPAASSIPVQGAPGLALASVVTGGAFSCGLSPAGAASCWGASGLGQLGDGQAISYSNTYTGAPAPVAGGHVFAQLSVGYTHACGVTPGGQAYCWGGSGSGKLGTGGNDTSIPAPVAGGLAFASVSAGAFHSCGVTTAFEVYCWGANGNGQLGSPGANGSTTPRRVNGGWLAAEVAAAGIGTGNGAHSCAIAKDRLTVYCWGRNDVGQLGNGATTDPTAVNDTPSIVVGQKPLPPA